jgi:hypothetical protein
MLPDTSVVEVVRISQPASRYSGGPEITARPSPKSNGRDHRNDLLSTPYCTTLTAVGGQKLAGGLNVRTYVCSWYKGMPLGRASSGRDKHGACHSVWQNARDWEYRNRHSQAGVRRYVA